MIKKTITYTDYNDVERTEDFYFNLSKAEITEMQLSTVGGLSEMLKQIVATQDVPSLIKFFKELIIKSYGQKSADGRKMIKNPELVEDFVQTEAFSTLYMELATDADAASAFVNGIVPKDLRQQISEKK